MKYKQIKSGAHNFADSFASAMNWADDDYVTGHLARAAVASGEPELRVDLLTGDAEPSALLPAPVKASLESRVQWLDGLLRSHGADIGHVRKATMRMRFDLSRVAKPGLTPTTVPFECEVRITGDRGVVHTGTVRASASLQKGAGISQSA